MLKGKKLEKGDTIGLIGLANSVSKDKILKTKEKIENLGYKVKLGKHIFESWYSFAGKDENRLFDLNNFFEDAEIDAILCIRGGYGSIRIVEGLNFEMIKRNPKIFVGYSDITTIHSALNERCDLITFHGPMGASNFLDIDEFTLKSFLESVTTTSPMEIINPIPLKTLTPGKAKGKVIGGNLITFMGDLGTPNELNFKDKILFIEEISEPTYKIDRALTQLLNSGKLKELKGIILGDFNNCIQSAECDMPLMETLKDRLEGLEIPIIYNFKSGHCKPMVTLPLGIEVEIDCDNLTIKTLEGSVK